MKGSTYLNWFRRLVILGAVVSAGALAQSAGAMKPTDGQSTGGGSFATIVSRPPDVSDVATRMSASTADVFERYAAAHPYGNGLSPTASAVSRPPDVQDTSLALATQATLVSRPPDVQDRADVIGKSVPQFAAVRPPDVADAAALTGGTGSSGRSISFQWDDWAIGIGTGVALALLLGVGLLMGQRRQHMQTA